MIGIIITKLSFHISILYLCFLLAFGTDSIFPGQSISFYQTITSRNGVYELGFLPSDSDCYYKSPEYICTVFGIWYTALPSDGKLTTVWGPRIYDVSWNYQSLQLTMSPNGNLQLSQGTKSVVLWSSRSSSEFNSTKLVLENNGNLVIRSILDPNDIHWQSFDHPTGTWLPGAKVKFNRLANKGQAYLSGNVWSNFAFEMDPKTMKSIILKKNGIGYGACRLNGISFSCSLQLGWYNGEADMILHDHTTISHVSNENETYFTYSLANYSILTRFIIDDNGYFTQLMWSEVSEIWEASKLRLADAYCNQYAIYNHRRKHFSTCSSAIEPDSQSQPDSEYGTVRQSLLQCHDGEKDGFLLIHNASIAGSNNAEISQPGNSERCKRTCMNDCSCTAFYYKDMCVVSNQSSFGLQYAPGFDLYYRLVRTYVTYRFVRTTKRKNESRFILLVLGATVGGISLILTLLVLIWKYRSMKIHAPKALEGSIVLMSYSELRRATKNFSNKLGEGGFGSVYRGTLPNSSDGVAVKHLKVHCQGDKQFRAEVSTIGAIHHINLVRLKGFCVEGRKKFLVYDYMLHGSLENHIFGEDQLILGWRTRYQIGLGIAKGLAYLHEECRECIIHCDTKPENILLDENFNPKIGDFGLAKLLGRDFSRVLTTMRGIRGYLAPEWLSGAAITSKADVYSYGMMLFEIISGKRNWSIRINEEDDYIPLQVMQKLISDGEVISLLDNKLAGDADPEELIRACRVAGWCIQEDEKVRLSMVQVVQILEGVSEVINPPIPRFLQYIAQIPEYSTAYHTCTAG